MRSLSLQPAAQGLFTLSQCVSVSSLLPLRKERAGGPGDRERQYFGLSFAFPLLQSHLQLSPGAVHAAGGLGRVSVALLVTVCLTGCFVLCLDDPLRSHAVTGGAFHSWLDLGCVIIALGLRICGTKLFH